MTTKTKPRLDPCQQSALDRARKALADSQTDTDPASYARHLGALEVIVADLIKLAEDLTGETE